METGGATGPVFTPGGTALNAVGQSVDVGSVESSSDSTGGSVSILLLSAMLGGALARSRTLPTVI